MLVGEGDSYPAIPSSYSVLSPIHCRFMSSLTPREFASRRSNNVGSRLRYVTRSTSSHHEKPIADGTSEERD